MTNVFVSLLVLIVGFILLMKGADFFVEGSSSIATRFHIPSLIIGLTIVAREQVYLNVLSVLQLRWKEITL